MRLRDENKRKHIIETAVKLFSEQPFHKVRLDDVAEAAGVGKGTVFIYFKNKEELYYSLVYEGFASFVDQAHAKVKQPGLDAVGKLRVILDGLVEHFISHPELSEVMRTVAVPDAGSSWDHKRKECADLIEGVIREGIAAGQFSDSHPQHTALYLMGMTRAVILYEGKKQNKEELTEHIMSVLLRGISRKGP
jgi:AcrR family transcriptional regulator